MMTFVASIIIPFRRRKAHVSSHEIAPLRKQIAGTASLYPMLSVAPTYRLVEEMESRRWNLPPGADGWVAIPNDEAIFRHHGGGVFMDREMQYCRTVRIAAGRYRAVFDRFINHEDEWIRPDYWQLQQGTAQAFEILKKRQPLCDIWIVGARLFGGSGSRASRGSLRASWRQGFGGTSIAALNILHNHPHLAERIGVGMACPGESCNGGLPSLRQNRNTVHLESKMIGEPVDGNLTLFLPTSYFSD